MRQTLLDKATRKGFKVYQNQSKKWIIEIHKNNKTEVIEEKETNKWLISFNGIPQILTETRTIIDII